MQQSNVQHSHRRLKLLIKLEASLETPMFILALLWLWLFVLELTRGLTVFQERLVLSIWILFVLEFALKLFLAPHKLRFLRRNFIIIIALFVPALRAFRLLRAIRLLRATRVVTSTRFARALTTGRRLFTYLDETQGGQPEAHMHIGILIACDPVQVDSHRDFAAALAADVSPVLSTATAIPWTFHKPAFSRLTSHEPLKPSAFLEEASRHMAEDAFDMLVVITDVPLISRRKMASAGLASDVCRIIVISTRQLRITPRGSAEYNLDDPVLRWNAASLLLHLTGHVSHLGHSPAGAKDVMAPFSFREQPAFREQEHFGEQESPALFYSESQQALLKKRAKDLPERELRGGNLLDSLVFHLLMMARHPFDVLRTLLRNRSILLPLSLPGLATAAVAPGLLLVFTAEIWDVGLNMSNLTATVYAILSIVAASLYLVHVQSLFLPRKDKHIVTEHLAVANTVIFLSIMMACLGLFLLVGVLMLLIQLYIFPAGLMQTWPTLDQSEVLLGDQVRLASFISTVGVSTGALAGGLESRRVIQHLALFLDET